MDIELIDWSRAQFSLTAMYHWIFVPITLGLGIIMALIETKYYKTNDEFWKKSAKFWQKIFAINFAIGVATGIIMEFQFGTNWSNYSWFVGDIFGAPLAIEGVLAFFMESTFIAVMFFGWDKVSKTFHLMSTWLTIIGATLSAYWILVANAWMQNPVGLHFNPETLRNEMTDFMQLAFSPFAVSKFFHTVISSWIVGAMFAMGICGYYFIKKKNVKFAISNMKIISSFGLIACILTMFTGHTSGYQVAQKQPMKLAAMEGLYKGSENASLTIIGMVNSHAKAMENNYENSNPNYSIGIPGFLSYLANNDTKSFVPGVGDILKGDYIDYNGNKTISAEEKIEKGKIAISALDNYRKALKEGDKDKQEINKKLFNDNFQYFGYGYFKNPTELVPDVKMTFYSFRIMIMLGIVFTIVFLLAWIYSLNNSIKNKKWLNIFAIVCVFLTFVCTQAGWITAEVGRQPWAIQDILPVKAAVSKVSTTSVKVTFFLFLILFTALLIAEIGIMLKAIKKGPNIEDK